MPDPAPRARVLAWLYLALALPLAIRLAVVTPPYQVADEPAHFLRATQIGQGGLVAGHWARAFLGGKLPANAAAASAPFDAVRFTATPAGDGAALRQAARLRWPGARARIFFGNTAIYPPVFYLPAAVTIDAARLLRLRVVATLRAVRIVDAVLATAVGAVAVASAAAGAPVLAVLLALPMTLSLFASANQDALLIATAALCGALLTHAPARRGLAGWTCLGLMLGSLAAARMPYIPLGALPAILAWRSAGRRGGLFASALAAAVALLWLRFGVASLFAETPPELRPFGAAQLRLLAHDPWRVLPIAFHTVAANGADYGHQIAGVLGWLTLPIPGGLYLGCGAAGVAALALSARRLAVPPAEVALASLTLALATGAVFGALYLNWTPVGAARVEGVQGRYFLPILAFLPVALPRGASRITPALAVVAALLVADWVVVPHLVAKRYQLVNAELRAP